MPFILCIETSSAICSVALTDGEAKWCKESNKTQAHAEVLTSLIQDCLHEAEISFNQLNAIAISQGPGSYTGLRIGTSTAKGLCFALGIPLIAINTLKLIASAAVDRGSMHLVWPMIDARRMEVYHCVYDHQLNALTEMQNGIITEPGFRPELIDNRTVICGDGAAKAVDILQLPYVDVHAHAETMCSLAIQDYHSGFFVDLQSYEPFYLKQANITSPTIK
jgi:tRNA threonylcarbamoyladenosine biosynthesis protein TsaB